MDQHLRDLQLDLLLVGDVVLAHYHLDPGRPLALGAVGSCQDLCLGDERSSTPRELSVHLNANLSEGKGGWNVRKDLTLFAILQHDTTVSTSDF